MLTTADGLRLEAETALPPDAWAAAVALAEAVPGVPFVAGRLGTVAAEVVALLRSL